MAKQPEHLATVSAFRDRRRNFRVHLPGNRALIVEADSDHGAVTEYNRKMGILATRSQYVVEDVSTSAKSEAAS